MKNKYFRSLYENTQQCVFFIYGRKYGNKIFGYAGFSIGFYAPARKEGILQHKDACEKLFE